jgi:inorganic pyrophosphatase
MSGSKRGEMLVVIETARGADHKLKFDPQLGRFRLSRVLPVGMVFPCDFGFIEGTAASDGDELDVALLLGSGVPTGTAVRARPVAVIVTEQREDGAWRRNDRVIAVPVDDPRQARIRSKGDLDPRFVDELRTFFAAMAKADGVKLRIRACRGRRVARRIIRRADKRARPAAAAG